MNHTEFAKPTPWIYWPLLAAFLAAIAGTLITAQDNGSAQYPFFVAAVALGWAFWLTTHMRFTLTDTYVRAEMMPFRSTVRYVDITHVEVKRLPMLFGLGLRLTPRGLAYVLKFGDAVWITRQTGLTKRLILRTNDPEAFAELLRKRLNS